MESVDFSVNESKCMVSYDRSVPELKNLASSCFDFRIEPSPPNPGQNIGVFVASEGGNVLRRNESEPFPPGTFNKKSVDVNKGNCNVTLKKSDKNVKISTYFI